MPRINRFLAFFALFGFSLTFSARGVTWETPVIIDHRCTDITKIPDNWVDSVRTNMVVFYSGGSHANQWATGLQLVAQLLGPEKYKVAYHTSKEGQNDIPTEPNALRVLNYGGNYLGASKLESIFSDQGGAINASGHGWCDEICKRDPANYINAVDEAEQQFPGVAFWYSTGIEDWDDKGVDTSLCRPNNNAIRNHCIENNRVLFDFIGLDMTDDDGNFHDTPAEKFGTCEWCKQYCSANDCETNDLEKQSSGHTHIYSCFRKGKAMWWMLARMAGWPGPDATKTTKTNISKTHALFSGMLSAKDLALAANKAGSRVTITDVRGRHISEHLNATGLSVVTAYDQSGHMVKTAVGFMK
jgi:hypothetical protein